MVTVPLAYGDGTAPAEASAVPEVVSNYDLNGNCIIDRQEVIRAIRDYSAGEISRDDVLSIIPFYFSREPVRTIQINVAVDSDKESLIALYRATGGLNWASDSGWLIDSPVGRWHGVNTNHCGRVTELVLHNNKLSGEIPAELGDLDYLIIIRLFANQLTGCVPAGLRDVRVNDFEELGLDFCES